jgi:mono/diheme cytochrome c family protein
MNARKWMVSVLIAGGWLFGSAQPTPKIRYAQPENVTASDGPQMFRAYCSVCHGVGGLGNGPAASALKKRPADLTQLARKNNGKFPVYRVANLIQGADPNAAHGSRDMPIWGTVFRPLGTDTVKLRVDNLTTYIASLQRR